MTLPKLSGYGRFFDHASYTCSLPTFGSWVFRGIPLFIRQIMSDQFFIVHLSNQNNTFHVSRLFQMGDGGQLFGSQLKVV